MLRDEPTAHLNPSGSPERGPENCPRTWHIFGHQPPHVSTVSWNSVTPAVRQHHIRCLNKLKAMPHELLRLNIASAVLECVRRDAVARQWSPSTLLKEYAAMAGALRDLTLYTTENRGVHLSEFPEWRAAQITARRMEREVDRNQFPPILHEQYMTALQNLRMSSPQAALFLGMMWALAARAGDVGCLRQKDVILRPEVREDGTVPLGIEQRFGKGTRFRGTYWPCSTLLKEEAAELKRTCSQRTPDQLLFPDQDTVRTQVRKALRAENRQAALPSIRRGAIRHLAGLGVSEAILMRLTGHKRVETLYRYIGLGPRPTQEAAVAQDGASLLHRPRPSTLAPRLQAPRSSP